MLLTYEYLFFCNARLCYVTPHSVLKIEYMYTSTTFGHNQMDKRRKQKMTRWWQQYCCFCYSQSNVSYLLSTCISSSVRSFVCPVIYWQQRLDFRVIRYRRCTGFFLFNSKYAEWHKTLTYKNICLMFVSHGTWFRYGLTRYIPDLKPRRTGQTNRGVTMLYVFSLFFIKFVDFICSVKYIQDIDSNFP